MQEKITKLLLTFYREIILIGCSSKAAFNCIVIG